MGDCVLLPFDAAGKFHHPDRLHALSIIFVEQIKQSRLIDDEKELPIFVGAVDGTAFKANHAF